MERIYYTCKDDSEGGKLFSNLIIQIFIDYQDFNISNSMWCTIITMTTVGFGDFFPVTWYGRIVVVVIVFYGIFIIAVLIDTKCKY